MKTFKSALLDQFLNEKVYITTELTSAVQLAEGEIVEAPLILEGIILDYDQEFILLGQLNRDALEVIRRDRIVGIKQVSIVEELFDDPDKPERDDMC